MCRIDEATALLRDALSMASPDARDPILRLLDALPHTPAQSNTNTKPAKQKKRKLESTIAAPAAAHTTFTAVTTVRAVLFRR